MKNLMAAGTKCLLIHPWVSKNCLLNYPEVCTLTGAKFPTPPLGLLTIAALLPDKWELKLLDANVETMREHHFEWADIVFTGGILSQQLEILSIIAQAHTHGKKVVVGGLDPSAQPQIYKEADYLIVGEGENTIPLLLRDLENGLETGVYSSSEKPEMRDAVVPRFDLVRHQDYLMMGLQYTRGCPYNCEFCNVIEVFGRKSRPKTTQQVLKELQTLYDLGYRGRIFFVDDNFFGDRQSVKDLLRAIAEWSRSRRYPFFFAASATINLADEEEILSLAQAAEFRYINFGIETPDNAVLDTMQKKQNLNRSIPETIRKFSEHGMVVDASLNLGFDGETERTADSMIRLLQESGISMALVGTLFALPGTQLTKRLISEGRMKDESIVQKDRELDVDHMTSGLNFSTLRPREEILQDYINVLAAIYAPVNYYERVLRTGLALKVSGNYRPTPNMLLKNFIVFLKVCYKAGFSRKTGKLLWKTLFIILLKNPRALEPVTSLIAMYSHLYRNAHQTIGLTKKKLDALEQLS
jgi:radical SAM superfamily enzyme YgiQ (UPF0313 family)